MNQSKAKEGSIGSKISLILIFCILISTLSIGIFCYFSYRNNALALTGEKAMAIAESVAAGIDGDRFVLYDKGAPEDGYYASLKSIMSDAKTRNAASYLYALTDDEANYKYIISGYLEGEDQTVTGYLGYTDPKDIFPENAALVFADGQSRYSEPQDYGPGYGLLVSGFAPIRDSSGTVVGIVGTDISANEQFDKINQLIPVMAFMMLATSAILFLASSIYVKRDIGAPLRQIAAKFNLLLLGDTDVDIDQKLLLRNDEVGLLGRGFIDMAGNVKGQAEIARQIASGNLAIEIEARSEKDVMSLSMTAVIEILQNLVKESRMLSQAAVEGALDSRGNASQFEGGFHDIIAGFNATLDAVVGPLKVAANYMDRISKGDIPPVITEQLNGEFEEIKNNVNTCIGAVNDLVSDMEYLSASAIEGRLTTRADSSRHSGDFARIVQGVNATLDAIIEPLQTTARYINEIGKGQIPEVITEVYNGDFDKIKENINSCIEGLSGLEEGRDVLARMALNDYAATVNGSYQGIFAEIGNSINQVGTRVNHTVSILSNIAAGDFQDLQSLKEIGKRCEADRLMPTVILTIETIKDLVEETRILSENAVNGNLAARGNTDKFRGEYAQVVRGINETLEAVVAPIREASAVLQEIAQGNLQLKMEGNYKGDHAEIKKALNETIANLRNYVEEISQVLSAMGEGDFDQSITAEYKGDFVEIKNSLNSISISLSQTLDEIYQAAEQVALGARQVSDASQNLSQGSTEQASTVEELTASVTEIANQTKQNAVNANQANELSNAARENGIRGNAQMKGMLSSMAEINESSANISKIIKVIDDIAFQTNILALNAAVEAARAGQHGKGFAVVAEEVRNLAARSADAAKETTALIEGSISKVEMGTRLANDTAAALNDIAAGIEKSAELVASIASSSNEQASGIAQVNMGIEQVSQVVQNNSATAEESAAASEELSSQAELLKEQVGRFKLKKTSGMLPDAERKALPSQSRSAERVQAPGRSRIVLDGGGSDKY